MSDEREQFEKWCGIRITDESKAPKAAALKRAQWAAWQAGRLAALEEAAQTVQCTPVGEPHTRGGWTREYCEYCQLAAAIRQLKERK